MNIELTTEEIEELINCLNTFIESDRDVLKYPGDFTKEEVADIQYQHDIHLVVRKKLQQTLNGVSSFSEAMSNVQ